MIKYNDYLRLEKGNYEKLGSNSRYQDTSIMRVCEGNDEIVEALENCLILNVSTNIHRRKTTDLIEVLISQNKMQVNINLADGSVENLVACIQKCKNLKCLCLEDDIEIADAFFDIIDLKYLFIRGCSIKENINKIFSICSLKVLYLNNTDLNFVPKEVEYMTDLEALSIMHTLVHELPDELCKLRKLRYLGMNGTQITNVPSVVEKLKKLQSLYLGQTQITELPSGLKELKELKHLAIWETPLTELPEWICGLKS